MPVSLDICSRNCFVAPGRGIAAVPAEGNAADNRSAEPGPKGVCDGFGLFSGRQGCDTAPATFCMHPGSMAAAAPRSHTAHSNDRTVHFDSRTVASGSRTVHADGRTVSSGGRTVRGGLLLGQRADERRELLDLRFPEACLEGGHRPLAVADLGRELLVRLLLHLRRAEVLCLRRLAGGRVRAAVLAVAWRAVLVERWGDVAGEGERRDE